MVTQATGGSHHVPGAAPGGQNWWAWDAGNWRRPQLARTATVPFSPWSDCAWQGSSGEGGLAQALAAGPAGSQKHCIHFPAPRPQHGQSWLSAWFLSQWN